MSYRIGIPGPVRRRIANLGMPDFLLVDVYLRLQEELAQNPPQHLRRTREPFDGMEYRFSLTDPNNRLLEHICVFHVKYGQDEETLWVVKCGYVSRFGV